MVFSRDFIAFGCCFLCRKMKDMTKGIPVAEGLRFFFYEEHQQRS